MHRNETYGSVFFWMRVDWKAVRIKQILLMKKTVNLIIYYFILFFSFWVCYYSHFHISSFIHELHFYAGGLNGGAYTRTSSLLLRPSRSDEEENKSSIDIPTPGYVSIEFFFFFSYSQFIFENQVDGTNCCHTRGFSTTIPGRLQSHTLSPGLYRVKLVSPGVFFFYDFDLLHFFFFFRRF